MAKMSWLDDVGDYLLSGESTPTVSVYYIVKTQPKKHEVSEGTFKQHPINLKNFSAHPHDIVHASAKFWEKYTAMHLRVSAKTKRDGQTGSVSISPISGLRHAGI